MKKMMLFLFLIGLVNLASATPSTSPDCIVIDHARTKYTRVEIAHEELLSVLFEKGCVIGENLEPQFNPKPIKGNWILESHEEYRGIFGGDLADFARMRRYYSLSEIIGLTNEGAPIKRRAYTGSKSFSRNDITARVKALKRLTRKIERQFK